MLYPKAKEPQLTEALFARPTSEYRAAPFWAWNCRLDRQELLRQIDVLRDMGMGGFHMHSRSGMATPYLSDDFMALVQACRDKAEETGLRCYLYDEDRWPSGAAGGYVTRDARYRARQLLWTPRPYTDEETDQRVDRHHPARQGVGTLLACYQVRLDETGALAAYERLPGAVPPGEGVWYAYLETMRESPWYNNETYVDTLNPDAIRRFIQITHERYAQVVGADFGGVIPSIFTDEPQFVRKSTLGFAQSQEDVILPFTGDLPETFSAAYGEDLLDCLPELFWDLPEGRPSRVRYRYHDHIAERFSAAFADTVGAWCQAHGLLLTGHMMEEPTLESQTAALGEAMRSYRAFQVPGIDMLCDRREFTTAKQAQSAARQYGCPGVMSELYGVTNWDFDFRGHKLQGDWQAALGVTLRVPHLAWVSMGGEAKRDYPASIHEQSPWHAEYPYVEDYFARINTALTRGKAVCRVGVLHPVESYWLHWGPKESSAAVRQELDEQFQSLAQWLLFGLIDYDYLAESLLPSQCPQGGAPLQVGQMAYSTILVPGCETLRATTVERLEAFQAAGGRLIFAGQTPTLVDAQPSDRVQRLAARALCVPLQRLSVLQALEPEREVDIRAASGVRTGGLLYQLRQDGERRWLFVCHGDKPVCPDVTVPEDVVLRLAGRWTPTLYDALTGDIRPYPYRLVDGRTEIPATLDAHDSLLLCLRPATAADQGLSAPQPPVLAPLPPVWGPVPVALSEPNALVLDLAEYRLDGEAWQPREEMLRLDNRCRERLGWALRTADYAQPWVTAAEGHVDAPHTLEVRYAVDSRVAVSGCKLALEEPGYAQIFWDGQRVDAPTDGFYVDRAIRTTPLPDITPGVHELLLRIDYRRTGNLEACYLLGDFGVVCSGSRAHLTRPVQTLDFTDETRQGLPFYGGNVTYRLSVAAPGGPLALEVPRYRGALVAVALDGQRVGRIVYAPHRLTFDCPAGTHEVTVTVFGNRINTFGCLHNCDPDYPYYGPAAWRTEGKQFSYEYCLRPTGLLAAPRLYRSLAGPI